MKKLTRGLAALSLLALLMSGALLGVGAFLDYVRTATVVVERNEHGAERLEPLFRVLSLVPQAHAATAMSRSDGTTAWSSTGNTIWYPIATADVIRIQIWSSAGSVASCVLQVSSANAGAPAFPLATVTDPTASGEYWSIPKAGFARVSIATYGSGTVQANIEAYRGGERIW